MNERIRELADEASHQSPDGYPVTIPYSKDFAKKFAQLIVAECVAVCMSRSGNNDYNVSRLHCVADIKKHFGVEE